jgi:alpha-tubulin suppressor-like RCC1 family protein
VESLALGQAFACATYGEFGHDSTACWGNNAIGQLGNGTYDLSTTPVDVLSLGNRTSFSSLTAGAFHACVLSYNPDPSDEEPFCWGDNSAGQLGFPSIVGNANYPVLVQNTALSGNLKDVNNLYAGGRYTCAEIFPSAGGAEGTCWGDNSHGQLGDGTTTAETHPTSTRLSTYLSTVGGAQTCGDIGSGLSCWGRNSQGQLGDGTTSDRIALGARVLIDDDIFGTGMDE